MKNYFWLFYFKKIVIKIYSFCVVTSERRRILGWKWSRLTSSISGDWWDSSTLVELVTVVKGEVLLVWCRRRQHVHNFTTVNYFINYSLISALKILNTFSSLSRRCLNKIAKHVERLYLLICKCHFFIESILNLED